MRYIEYGRPRIVVYRDDKSRPPHARGELYASGYARAYNQFRLYGAPAQSDLKARIDPA
jgi:hypothetical protein